MSFDALVRDLDPGAAVQAAGLVTGYGGPARAAGFRLGNQRLRCASLLKPLYAWVADRTPEWASAAEPAVVESSNADTLRLWLGTGPLVILDRLAERTGVRWAPPSTDPASFGSVEVAASEVVTAYAALAQAGSFGDRDAQRILQWMVAATQTFGVRELFPGEVAVKCGWFGGADESWLRTHVVTVDRRDDGRIRLACALTALPYPGEAERAAYRRALATGGSVEDEHDRVGGGLLRELIPATLAELG
ncbi:hypothetical protein [Nonomuraea sp. NPDC050310]|uniref:hypothetical protein n=1 Tax=Nonomuraea sp. NPDC050310 TaxID=3154935 RepID=UPI0033D5969C